MVYSIYMKKKLLVVIASVFLFSFVMSCEDEEPPKPAPTVQAPAPKPQEPPKEEPKEEPKPAVVEVDEADEEYIRSTSNLDTNDKVTKAEFNEDKAAILKIIEELSVIMETKDINGWLKYIEPESIKYYKNPVNLQKAQQKLPNKTIRLKSINDYFKYVFIPSRKRSKVDEIRYISKTSIKAVQVKSDKSIVVYYYFTKVGNEWLVQLPTID